MFSYGALRLASSPPEHGPHLGLTVVTCERGEARTTPTWVTIHGRHGRCDLEITPSTGWPGYHKVFADLREAIRTGEPARHDGRWGKATLEVVLGLLTSTRTSAPVTLEHQVAVRPALS